VTARPTEADLEAYAEWLAETRRPMTVKMRLRQLRLYVRDRKVEGSRKYKISVRESLRFYQEFARETGRPQLALEEPHVPKPRREPRTISESKRGIPADQWKALFARILNDRSAAARAIEVLMVAGLRIGDLLRIERYVLKSALANKTGHMVILVKGGDEVAINLNSARSSWERLFKMMPAKAPNVAAAVAPRGSPHAEADGAAYRQCERALKRLAKHTVEGKVHLHRLRRSVAAHLFRGGSRLEEIQKVLGHRSRNTTEIYTSEAMPELVADTLSDMHRALGLEELKDQNHELRKPTLAELRDPALVQRKRGRLKDEED
jgi:site-specific recombinase XerD